MCSEVSPRHCDMCDCEMTIYNERYSGKEFEKINRDAQSGTKTENMD